MSQVRHGREYLFAAINVAAGASTEVIAAVTGRKIVVCGIVLNSNVAGTVTLVHTTGVPVALSGVLTLGNPETVSLGDFTNPLTETPVSVNFGLTTVTCTCDGLVVYYLD